MRWQFAVTHDGDEFEPFLRHRLDRDDAHVLLVAGAGFDPRSTILASLLATMTEPVLRGIFVREERPDPDHSLVAAGEANLAALNRFIPDSALIAIEVFGSDGTVVGGRRLVQALDRVNLDGVTDIVVDVSALSVGASFPAVRYLREVAMASAGQLSLHLVVAHEPAIDSSIRRVPSDNWSTLHGFDGRLNLVAGSTRVARLWLPLLAHGRAPVLRLIYEGIDADEVCPIVPFPSGDPRKGDRLLEELLESDGFPWGIDSRSVVYADEADPLDLYRTILRLDSLRKPVFEALGTSQLVLSPLGSKPMAIGCLLAALELDLPVVYVEDYSYEPVSMVAVHDVGASLQHIWLEGPHLSG